MPRLSKDDYGLSLVGVVRERAACTRRQVGAVVLDSDGRIAGTGYNGVPAGMTHCDEGGCPRGRFTYADIPANLGNAGHPVPCLALHAERNALKWALDHGTDLSRATLYVSEEPCPDCRAYITACKISRVIVLRQG